MDKDTEEKLKAAFAGESQANRKYLSFSKIAEKEGFPNVAKLFKAIADAETVHALNHFKLFGSGSTVENLEAAMGGEHYEVHDMYPEFLEVAKKAGEKGAIRTFTYAVEAEKIHEDMYKNALDMVKDGKDIDIPGGKIAICQVCGHTIYGDAPDECPICKAKKDAFTYF
ncbi:MAG: rubrerythrin family protein [Promethearchaeota archaeon]